MTIVDTAPEAPAELIEPQIQPQIAAPTPQFDMGGGDLGGLFGSVEEPDLLAAGSQALFGEGNARDRLLAGSTAPAGGVTARASHAEWKAVHPAPVADEAPALPEQLMAERPGMDRRTYQILAPSDAAEVARGLGRWDPTDEAKNAAGSALFESYADLIETGGTGAQVDLARFNTAMSKDMFRYEGNKPIRDLWKRFTNNPETLLGEGAADDTAALFSAVKAFGDATGSVVDDDLAIGLVGRVDRVDVSADGVSVYVRHPSGWNDGMTYDRATREARLNELNYRALAPQGAKNLEQIYNMGDQDMVRVAEGGQSIFSKPLKPGATTDGPMVVDQDTLDAFIGLDSGVPSGLSALGYAEVRDVVVDTITALAKKRDIEPQALQAVIGEAWRQAKAEAGRDGWSRNDPFMLESGGVKNPVFEALNGRGDAAIVSLQPGDMMNVQVLRATDVTGLTSIAQPDGTVVVAASTSDAVAAAQPTMYPAIDGADRVPRWARSEPRQFQDLKRYLSEGQPTTSDSVTYLNAELSKMGGVPGLRDETTITFVTDDRKVSLSAGRGRVTELARGAREAPTLDHSRLGVDDLTPESFVGPASPLNTHAWVVLQPGPDSKLFSELQKSGYKAVQARDGRLLVFGMTSEEGIAASGRHGGGEVYTSTGKIEGAQPPATEEVLDDSFEVNIGGQTVKFRLSDFNAEAAGEGAGLTERTRRSQRTVQVSVKVGTDVKALADEFAERGYGDITVYAPQTNLDGWERAYEKYATDGQQTVVTRHSSGAIGDPHGRHVFVKSAGRYPDWQPAADGSIVEQTPGTTTVGNSLRIDGVFPDGTATIDGVLSAKLNGKSTRTFGWANGVLTPIFDEAEAASGRFGAIVRGVEKTSPRGKKSLSAVIEPADGTDIVPATQVRAALAEAGWDVKSEMKADGKTFGFSKPASDATFSQMAVVRAGTVQGRIHNTKPVSAFEESFGFTGDFSYRAGDQVVSLDPAIQESSFGLTGRVMDLHGDAIRRWRLGGVVVADVKNEAYAWMEFESGGRIVLPAEWWSQPAEFAAALRRDRADGSLSSRLDDSTDGILAHEYGHVLHGALRLEERMVKDSTIDKEIRSLVARSGSGRWNAIAKREISDTAAREPAELVAEAFSEVLLAKNPSRLAQNVYDLVNDRLGSALKFRKAVNF